MIAKHKFAANENLRTLLSYGNSGRLLDIGCSTGLFLNFARSAGWDVRGLEYSKDSAQIAIEQYGLLVDQGELKKDTYQSESFDVVTLWDVIEHLPDPRQTICNIHHILKPDGLLILKTPNADGLFPRLSYLLARTLNFWAHPEPPEHLFQFSTSTLSSMLEKEDFTIVDVHHQRISIEYSFGAWRDWFRSTKWLFYCAVFIPFAMLGPTLRMGDDITIVARRNWNNPELNK